MNLEKNREENSINDTFHDVNTKQLKNEISAAIRSVDISKYADYCGLQRQFLKTLKFFTINFFHPFTRVWIRVSNFLTRFQLGF